MDHLQVASAGTGLVLQLTQAHVGPPVTAAHLLLLLLAVAAVRLVADVGTAPRPLARDNIGVNSIMVGVIANTVVDLLQTKKIQTVSSQGRWSLVTLRTSLLVQTSCRSWHSLEKVMLDAAEEAHTGEKILEQGFIPSHSASIEFLFLEKCSLRQT